MRAYIETCREALEATGHAEIDPRWLLGSIMLVYTDLGALSRGTFVSEARMLVECLSGDETFGERVAAASDCEPTKETAMEYLAMWEANVHARDPVEAARIAAAVVRDQAINWTAYGGAWTIFGEGLPSEGKLVDLELEPPTRQARYLDQGGNRCPNCQSLRIEVGPLHQDESTVEQVVQCRDCRAEWTNVFALVEYKDLQLEAGWKGEDDE